jgi:hypothetical protein
VDIVNIEGFSPELLRRGRVSLQWKKSARMPPNVHDVHSGGFFSLLTPSLSSPRRTADPGTNQMLNRSFPAAHSPSRGASAHLQLPLHPCDPGNPWSIILVSGLNPALSLQSSSAHSSILYYPLSFPRPRCPETTRGSVPWLGSCGFSEVCRSEFAVFPPGIP